MTRQAQLHWQQFELVFELDAATQTQLRVSGDWAVPRMSLQLGSDEGARFAVPQALCEAMRERGFNGMRARLLQPEQGWLQLRLLRGWHEPSGWQSEHLLTLGWDGDFTLIEEMCAR